jgi:hypothetical protein
VIGFLQPSGACLLLIQFASEPRSILAGPGEFILEPAQRPVAIEPPLDCSFKRRQREA